jgi:hypothetical protein
MNQYMQFRDKAREMIHTWWEALNYLWDLEEGGAEVLDVRGSATNGGKPTFQFGNIHDMYNYSVAAKGDYRLGTLFIQAEYIDDPLIETRWCGPVKGMTPEELEVARELLGK